LVGLERRPQSTGNVKGTIVMILKRRDGGGRRVGWWQRRNRFFRKHLRVCVR